MAEARVRIYLGHGASGIRGWATGCCPSWRTRPTGSWPSSADRSAEVAPSRGRLEELDRPAGITPVAGEADARGQQDGRPEVHLGGERVGQASLERGQAARLQPHAVGDGAAEPEEARGEWVEMDGVDVG